MIIEITSIQNERIKEIVKLRNKHERDTTDLFLIEGYREILRATEAGWKINELYFCKELFLGCNENALIATLKEKGVRLFSCSQAVFNKISYRDRPDGLLAIAPQKHLHLNELTSIFQKKPKPLFVIAEAIEKPGNLGTILRSSDAVGVDALILCDQCTDLFNPNVVRASVGTLFSIPVIEAKSQEALHWLLEHQVSILAATPHADREFTAIDMSGPLAIAVGTEQLGLSEQWLKGTNLQARIPMRGIADSLNVAMATTLLLYEALRQRTCPH